MLLIVLARSPDSYARAAFLSQSLVSSLISVALVPAIACSIRQQPISIANAYRTGLFRYGVLVMASALVGGMLLIPAFLLLNGLVDQTLMRVVQPITPILLLRLACAGILVLAYVLLNLLMLPVGVLERGGPVVLIRRLFELVIRYGWELLLLLLTTLLLTIVVPALLERLVYVGWNVTLTPLLSSFGAVGVWANWIALLCLSQAILLVSLPFQIMLPTLWYLEKIGLISAQK